MKIERSHRLNLLRENAREIMLVGDGCDRRKSNEESYQMLLYNICFIVLMKLCNDFLDKYL